MSMLVYLKLVISDTLTFSWQLECKAKTNIMMVAWNEMIHESKYWQDLSGTDRHVWLGP